MSNSELRRSPPTRIQPLEFAVDLFRSHLSSQPTVVIAEIEDASNNVQALTTYTYDESTPTATSGTPQHVAITGSRGNLTTVAVQANSTTTLYRKFAYYDTGTLNTSTEPSTSNTTNGATTTYHYSTASCGNSFVTSISEPLSLSRSMTWNCNGGVLTQVNDENGQPITSTYGDPNFWRITQASFPDGGQTTTTYNTVTPPWNIQSSSKIDSARNVTTETVLDGFARPIQQQLTSDPNGVTYTDTTYDAVGRVASASNPYHTTSDSTYGVTQYAYDALNRITAITHQDSKQMLFTYAKAATQITDEGNNSSGTTQVKKVNQSDGLGRLKAVCEVSSATLLGGNGTPSACSLDIAATGFLSSYQYDVLGNVTSVTQSGLNPRTYVYDQLSRLTSETNPESGTATYSYDVGTAGDLYQRVRPAPNQTNPSTTVTTTYTHDALHRLTGVSYSDNTPGATLLYDLTATGWGEPVANSKGRLSQANTNLSSGCSISVFSYDAVGREVLDDYSTPLNCGTGSFPMTYSYDYLGNLTSVLNHAENVTYTYSYDTASRLTKLQSSLNNTNHPPTLFTVNTYNALGRIQQASLGNGIVRNIGYDKRGRIASLADGSIYSYTLGYAPDSSILTGNDSLNGSWTYTYDDFDRVATASKSGQAFAYKYDRFGNRWQQNVTSGSGPNPSYTFDANNHISTSGFTYDAAGNILNDGSHSYTYDAENRLLTVDGTTANYVYDFFNHRIRSTVNSNTRDFVFDIAKRQVAEMNGTSWLRGEVYAGGWHIATYYNSTTYFDHSDWLGTMRVHTGVTGTSVETCTSLPFGDAQTCSSPDYSRLHFTGSEWDSESNLHHFPFRQLSTTQGRWISPDPAGLAAVDMANPQTWNRYVYVANNPLSSIDPLGLFICKTACPPGGGGGGVGDCTDASDPSCPPVPPPCDPFDPSCGGDGGGGGGDGGGGGGTDGGVPRGGRGGSGPPQRKGGVWPDNETLGLPSGLNLRPLTIWDAIGLTPGTQCGDFGACVPMGNNVAPAAVAAVPCLLDPVCAAVAVGVTIAVAGIELYKIHQQTQSKTKPGPEIDEACELFASKFDGKETECMYHCSELNLQLCSKTSGACPRFAMSNTLVPCD